MTQHDEIAPEAREHWDALIKFVEGLPDGALILTKAGAICAKNDVAGAWIRDGSDVAIHWTALFEPSSRIELNAALEKVAAGHTLAPIEATLHSVPLHVELRFSPLTWVGNYILVQVRDISEFRRTLAKVEESERHWRSLAALSREGLIIHENGIIRDVNEALVRLLGYEQSHQLIGRSAFDVIRFPPESRDELLRHMTGSVEPYDIEFIDAADQLHPVELRGINALFEGNPVRVVYVRDISERKLTEKQLRESETRFRQLFDGAADPLYILDIRLVIVDLNEPARHSLGYERAELIGQHLSFIETTAHNLDRDALRRQMQERGSTTLEGCHKHKDGSTFPVEVRISPFLWLGERYTFCAARDITERKRAEAERIRLEAALQHSQKVESIGRLAGGVAHDFNNMLTAIAGNVSLLIADLETDHPHLELLHEIQKVSASASNLTRQLLAYSRKQVIRPSVLDLNARVHSMQKMLFRLLGEDIELTVALDAQPANVRIDPGQLEQVLVNLCINARDAMHAGGTLRIATANVELDATYCASHNECTPGRYVELSVSDSGTGMSEEVLAHVFEPFYTTKEVGQGTGLGLAMVYGTVQQHGGSIDVDSTLDTGTTFKIYLAQIDEPGIVVPKIEPTHAAQDTGTIVLVEDEASVRVMVERLLRRSGYSVLSFATGQLALDALCAPDSALPVQDVDLLITDVVMPGMSGPRLVERLHALAPKLPVLFTSGYGEELVAQHGVLRPGIEFIGKPYTIADFTARVRELLHRVGRG